MNILGGDGRAVPDNDGGGHVVQRQGVRVGVANVGAVVSNEPPGEEPHHEGRLANTATSQDTDLHNLLLLSGEIAEETEGNAWLLTVRRSLRRGHCSATELQATNARLNRYIGGCGSKCFETSDQEERDV